MPPIFSCSNWTRKTFRRRKSKRKGSAPWRGKYRYNSLVAQDAKTDQRLLKLSGDLCNKIGVLHAKRLSLHGHRPCDQNYR